jgi:hypothetical protein
MNDILIHALAAGIAAGLGALLGRFIAERLGLAGAAKTILLVAFVVVPLTLSRHLVDRFVLAPTEAAQVAEAFQSSQLFQIVDAHYPEASAKIHEDLSAHVEGRMSEDDVQRSIRSVLLDLKLQVLPRASQSNTLEALKISREQIGLVAGVSEAECDDFVMTGFTETPLERVFGAALVEKEMTLILAMLSQAATNPATWTDASSAKMVETSIVSSIEKIMATLPAREREAAIAQIGAGGKEHMCRITLALLDSFLSLPPEKAAAAFQHYNSLAISDP